MGLIVVERAFDSFREASPSFDGNRTDDIIHWYFPNTRNLPWTEILAGLMEMTEEGHLQWCLFPALVPRGSRYGDR